jgi:hypothetical protein
MDSNILQVQAEIILQQRDREPLEVHQVQHKIV